MIGHTESGQYKRNIARAIFKKYCPPCHKARGIHNFILATKSPVWIIIIFTSNMFLKSHMIWDLTWPMSCLLTWFISYVHLFLPGCYIFYVLVNCHAIIYLTEVGVMYEAGHVYCYLEHLVPLPIWKFYICPYQYLGSYLSCCT